MYRVLLVLALAACICSLSSCQEKPAGTSQQEKPLDPRVQELLDQYQKQYASDKMDQGAGRTARTAKPVKSYTNETGGTTWEIEDGTDIRDLPEGARRMLLGEPEVKLEFK